MKLSLMIVESLSLIVAIFCSAILLVMIVGSKQCRAYQDNYRADTKYTLLTGCLIKDGNRYVTMDSYLVTVNR